MGVSFQEPLHVHLTVQRAWTDVVVNGENAASESDGSRAQYAAAADADIGGIA